MRFLDTTGSESRRFPQRTGHSGHERTPPDRRGACACTLYVFLLGWRRPDGVTSGAHRLPPPIWRVPLSMLVCSTDAGSVVPTTASQIAVPSHLQNRPEDVPEIRRPARRSPSIATASPVATTGNVPCFSRSARPTWLVPKSNSSEAASTSSTSRSAVAILMRFPA